MRQHLDMESTKTIQEVVDGQQRISAVLDFYANRFRLSKDDSPYGRATFEQLPQEAQRDFLKYEFSVDVLIDAADADVLGHIRPNQLVQRSAERPVGAVRRTRLRSV